MEREEKYILSSLDNALGVLNLFFECEELTAAEAAQRLGISRTAAFRLLYTLESKGYLTRSDAGSYRLGIKIFSLGQLAQRRMVLIKLIRPYLAQLAETLGETAQLAVMDGPNNVVFIDTVAGRQNLRMDTPVGYRRWAHQTGTGKTMLSYQSDEFIHQYVLSADMSPLTENSITTEQGLLDELHTIRERGWACDNEECELGLTCYAVPVIGALQKPIAAISCAGPTTRMAANREKSLAMLKHMARQIENNVRSL